MSELYSHEKPVPYMSIYTNEFYSLEGYQNKKRPEERPSQLVVRLLSRFGSRLKLFDIFGDAVPPGRKKETGYYPRKDVIYLCCQFPGVGHEIAHMVEIFNKRRLVIADWGLPLYANMEKRRTSQIIAGLGRECRVRAIQNHIYNHPYTGCEFQNPTWTDALNGRYPCDRFKSRKDLIEWMEAVSERAYKAWSPDRIVSEWDNRADYILNWMETK